MGISKGTVRKIGKRWYVDITVDGQRIQKPVSESKQKANAYLEAMRVDYYRGELRYKKDSTTRFRDYAKKYLEYSKVTKRSWQRDQVSIKALNTFFGSMLLSKINAGHIVDYKTERVKVISASSVNRELACLSAIFTMAIKSKIVDQNPVRNVKKFPERKLDMRILNNDENDEAERLLKYSGEKLKPIIMIALNTGMRRGEILKLRWNDIDFDMCFINLKETKNNRIRKIPMNRLVEDALKGIKREGEFVFPNPKTGKQLTTVRKAFKTACEKAGLDELRFHDLRHTAATWMITAGIDIVTVSEILGHSDIKMTMRYAHPTPENKRHAVEKLAAVFGRFGEIRGNDRIQSPANPYISSN